MILAKVTGTVVATQKVEALDKQILLIVRPIKLDGNVFGKPIVAVDTVQAGVGDRILIIDEGGSAGIILGSKPQAVRTIVAAIVDKIDVTKRTENNV